MNTATTETKHFEFQGRRIDLKSDEVYVATIITPASSYHLVRVLGQKDCAGWAKQMEWAKSIGADLPNRVDGALLFSTMPDDFEKELYWLNEMAEWNHASAWSQDFASGYQDYYRKSAALRAVAVRRLTLQ